MSLAPVATLPKANFCICDTGPVASRTTRFFSTLRTMRGSDETPVIKSVRRISLPYVTVLAPPTTLDVASVSAIPGIVSSARRRIWIENAVHWDVRAASLPSSIAMNFVRTVCELIRLKRAIVDPAGMHEVVLRALAVFLLGLEMMATLALSNEAKWGGRGTSLVARCSRSVRVEVEVGGGWRVREREKDFAFAMPET